MCPVQIGQSHKSHNAPVSYPTMYNFLTEMCTWMHISVKNGALWDICLMHCGICEMKLLRDATYMMEIWFWSVIIMLEIITSFHVELDNALYIITICGSDWKIQYRAVSRFAPSQWEKVLLCNDVSHWLGTRTYESISLNSGMLWVNVSPHRVCFFSDIESVQHMFVEWQNSWVD